MGYENLPQLETGSRREPAYLNFYLLAKRVEGKSEKTLEWYESVLKAFARFCKENGFPDEPARVSAHSVRAFLAYLQDKGDQKGTVNNRFRALRAFFNWCVAEGYIEASPLRNIRAPSLGKPLVPIFRSEHIDMMLSFCPPNRFWGARDRALVLTFLATGVRLAEMAGLMLADIDWGNQRIKVRGKGDKERKIYLSPAAQKALLRYLSYRRDGLPHLWVTEERDRPLTAHGIQLVLHRLRERTGIKGVRLSAHTFRHTFAVNLLRAGVSLRHLQEIMGHSSMKPLEVYLRMIDAEDAARVHQTVDPLKSLMKNA
jgi:site-specific recombinase XerD